MKDLELDAGGTKFPRVAAGEGQKDVDSERAKFTEGEAAAE